MQARAGWAVGWKKPEFWGRDALLAEKERAWPRPLWGLRRPPTAASRGRTWRCCARAGEPIGEVTSGTFSPTLKKGIALALLEPPPT